MAPDVQEQTGGWVCGIPEQVGFPCKLRPHGLAGIYQMLGWFGCSPHAVVQIELGWQAGVLLGK